MAEVTSGVRTPGAFQQLRARLGALTMLEPPPDLWERVAAARFSGIARVVPLDVELF